MADNAARIPEMFGSMVFGDRVMKEKLPPDIYKALRHTINRGTPLELDIANAVASAMKEWALSLGATHYTHWFQPMTGVTAEKHDSFIEPADGTVIMEFTGKELVKGEPDASSFPSGGLRATFEARGYTAWDPSSYAFIKDKTLCIPTAFCSYSGQTLDKKTPLLRSMELASQTALRIARLFGQNDVKGVMPTAGAEQEYFLIDREMYEKRPDLRLCGRTLLGARSPKGQQLDDHYIGAIKPRVKAFMEELDEELWKLGIPAKTEHNEAAPAQHELAPVYTTANLSCDQNQLMMEMMKKVALRHGLVCLLHEKPFAGVNGSGKHVNWSIQNNYGYNLFRQGDTPWENAQFVLALTAVVSAVDDYADLVRMSVATAGNDHRLGGNEAPPAIVSIFLGDDLTELLERVAAGGSYEKKGRSLLEAGAKVLPALRRDNTDRNRTSPIAYTGNKFEFRMPGSSLSISGPLTTLNTIVCDRLGAYADELEKADDLMTALTALARREYSAHKRVVFNGDGYSEEWRREAERRGLPNAGTAPEAQMAFLEQKNMEVFIRNHIFTKEEIVSRTDIGLEVYAKIIDIEARTLSGMIHRDVLPSVEAFAAEISDAAFRRDKIGLGVSRYEEHTLSDLGHATDRLYEDVVALDKLIDEAKGISALRERAVFFGTSVIPKMNELRTAADSLELITSRKFWPYPSYADLLFSV